MVVGVDPPATVRGGDACGIVVCGLGEDGIGYVLADASVAGGSPEGWARDGGGGGRGVGRPPGGRRGEQWRRDGGERC